MMKISRTNALFVATEVAFDQASDNPGYDYDDDDKHNIIINSTTI
jgi:hypothetical protein